MATTPGGFQHVLLSLMDVFEVRKQMKSIEMLGIGS